MCGRRCASSSGFRLWYFWCAGYVPCAGRSNRLPLSPCWSTRPAGIRFYLTNNETLIGRSAGSDIVLNFPTVSRNHAVIACRDGDWFIYDTKSKAGVEVNDKPVDGCAPIKNGDRLSLGGVVYLFSNRIID